MHGETGRKLREEGGREMVVGRDGCRERWRAEKDKRREIEMEEEREGRKDGIYITCI